MARLSEELRWRGLVHQVTDDDVLKLLDAESLTAYIGFDPTADSLHVGSLLQLCNLRRMQQAGHRAVALAGGGTGMIGDPGGKSEERNLLDGEALARNLAGIRTQLERFLDFSDDRALLVNNGDWLWSVRLLDFLRDIGKHFTVNQMVAKESVKARFESREHGISFTEFSYMLLQAYDFLELFDRHGCTLQLGGSDQWGNITMGVDLIRKVRGETAYGLTSPLVLKADGTKFGKSEAGSVWLDASKTPVYDFYQFWINVEDSMAGTYLRYFTWLSREEVEALDAATASRPERRQAQRALAFEVTALVHGRDAAEAAVRETEARFAGAGGSGGGGSGGSGAADATVVVLAGVAPTLVEALVAAGLCSSKSDARRAIDQGGAYVDDERATEDGPLPTGRPLKLRRGKKRIAIVQFG
jgi:tyrosyl-tRNA synthetase